MVLITSHLAGRGTGRPGGRRLLGALLVLGGLVTGCAHPAPNGQPTDRQSADPQSTVPDVMDRAWSQPGLLDIRFTSTHHDEQGIPRTSQIHTVFTVGADGQVRAMQSTQAGAGIVTSRTTWSGGTAIESAQLPGCRPAITQVPVPASLASWLAETFGPVDPTTAAGWTVSGSTASRPGSTADTVEQAQLTSLPERATREIARPSGAVVSEVTNIKIQHIGTIGPPSAPLPGCGRAAPLTAG